MERRLSSSDEEAKSKAKAPTGPAQLKYRIHYDHQAKSLVLRVLEGRVSPTLYLEGKVTSHLIQRSDFGQNVNSNYIYIPELGQSRLAWRETGRLCGRESCSWNPQGDENQVCVENVSHFFVNSFLKVSCILCHQNLNSFIIGRSRITPIQLSKRSSFSMVLWMRSVLGIIVKKL